MNQKEIEELSKTKENSCSCDTCKSLCRKVSCIGTPEDILKLINNGYINQLEIRKDGAGAVLGVLPIIDLILPKFDDDRGCCTFLTEDNLCSIHHTGLKPTEGKLSSHNANVEGRLQDSLHFVVAKQWIDARNAQTIIAVLTAFIKHYKRQPTESPTPNLILA